ncbi:DUF3775 domain-containing protein [Parvularcula dongshanensis]|uniref:DUF3775 domain-containing protein n=1 Tax=Parvularcula dongshanensis TaxID=1173995 RepID=A0A840I2H5_9PROT|nr:DUF3775 domain-containing protein [Parvularcula dongshanensis]MBB4659206.1 hypothetical protein [Parvularcula dongshanensis]
MATVQSMSIDESTVRSIIVQLRAYHAKEAGTDQNDGSNDTDDIHDDLEMHEGTVDVADLQGLYADLNRDQRYDLAALALLGMEEAGTLDEGRQMAGDEGQPGMREFLEMPLSPQYLAEGLDLAGYSATDDSDRIADDDEHATP